MSRRCELTGVGPFSGNRVSHSNIKTRTRWLPNVKNKKYVINELSQTITVKLSTSAIKTIDKQGGIVNAVLKGKEDKMSERLLKLKRQVEKKRRAGTAPKATA